MNTNYSCLRFEDVQDPTYCNISSFLFDFSEFINRNKYVIAVLGVVMNIFHMIVLTRKSMRSNCINILMIGVSICDLYNMSNVIYTRLVTTPILKCEMPDTFIVVLLDDIVSVLDGLLRRLSSWIGILMASVRYLCVKYPLSPMTSDLSKPPFALKSIFFTLVLSIFVSGIYRIHFSIEEVFVWEAPEDCDYPSNFTVSFYGYLQKNFSLENPLIIQTCQLADGISQIIPALTLPILTFLLIRELRKTERNRNKVLIAKKAEEYSKTDHTTKMIMVMTICSTLAEGPIGLIIILQMFTGDTLTTITANLFVIFSGIVALNTITHCLVCLVISSQYRKTAVEIFVCEKYVKKNTRITPNSNVSTMKKGTVV